MDHEELGKWILENQTTQKMLVGLEVNPKKLWILILVTGAKHFLKPQIENVLRKDGWDMNFGL